MTHTPVDAARGGGLAAALREGTKEHHVRAERHPLQAAIARGKVDRRTYGRIVAQNRALQEALEGALDAGAEREPRLARVFAPHHRRLANFDADLDALGVEDRGVVPATDWACGWIRGLGEREPLSLLGVLYVLEGSTNGGQFLAHPLRAALGLQGNEGLSSLNPHGDRTRELWAGFRASVDSLALEPAEADAIIAAAQETFDVVGRVLDGVAGS